jgi:hypothetical protein
MYLQGFRVEKDDPAVEYEKTDPGEQERLAEFYRARAKVRKTRGLKDLW